MRLSDVQRSGGLVHDEALSRRALTIWMHTKCLAERPASLLCGHRIWRATKVLRFLEANIVGGHSHGNPAETHDLERRSRGRGVKAAYRPFKPGGGGSSPSGPSYR